MAEIYRRDRDTGADGKAWKLLRRISGPCSGCGRKGRGVETELAKLLGQYTAHPVTYAGGVGSMADIEELRKAGQGRLDVTVGSALDILAEVYPLKLWLK